MASRRACTGACANGAASPPTLPLGIDHWCVRDQPDSTPDLRRRYDSACRTWSTAVAASPLAMGASEDPCILVMAQSRQLERKLLRLKAPPSGIHARPDAIASPVEVARSLPTSHATHWKVP